MRQEAETHQPIPILTTPAFHVTTIDGKTEGVLVTEWTSQRFDQLIGICFFDAPQFKTSFLKQRLRELIGVEGLQVVRLLAEADLGSGLGANE